MTISRIARTGASLAHAVLACTLVAGVSNADDFVYTNNDTSPNEVTAFKVMVDGLGNPISLDKIADYPTGDDGSGGGFFASNRVVIAVVGDFLYAANGGSDTISVFSINANGTLSTVGTPVATGGTAGSGISLGVTSDGAFLLAGNAGSSDISVFTIGASGSLTAVAGSPFTVPAVSEIDGLRITPDGNFVMVAEPVSPNSVNNTGLIHVLSIAGSGALAPITGSPFDDSGLSINGGAAGLDVTCKSDRLYAGEATLGNTIVDVYDIDDGTVTGVPGSLVFNSIFTPGTGTNSNNVLLSRDQKLLFVSNNHSAQVSVFGVAANGSLSLVAGSPFSMNGSPGNLGGLATNLDGTLLYVANFDNSSVSVFEIAPSGALSELSGSPFATGAGASSGLLSLTAYPSSICGLIPVANDDPTPEGPDDPIMAKSGETITIDVLANDENLDDGVASVVTTTPGSGGTAVVQPDFSVEYTSAPGFGGEDTFTYTITDINGDKSESAEVTVVVDGSTAVTQSGTNKVVFGGAVYPGSTAALSAAVELAQNSAESNTRCCTVRDPRVGAGNTKKEGPTAFNWVPFDIGAAMNTALGDADCADMPALNPGQLIIPRHFGVHTQNPNSNNPAHYRFGLCVVETALSLNGPVSVDVVADDVVGYPVQCKLNQGVSKQPLTLGLSTDPAEFTAPEMRAVTSECDPRGVTRWSTWWFVVNGQHLTAKEDSKTYVGRMSSVLKNMIEAMRGEGAVNSGFLDQLKGYVLQAEALFSSRKTTPAKAATAMGVLDDATLLALQGPGSPYSSSASFGNPKGDLVSHFAALRYAVCSELAFPNALANCVMDQDVVNALPTLPQGPSP